MPRLFAGITIIGCLLRNLLDDVPLHPKSGEAVDDELHLAGVAGSHGCS
jgi:hypothetical protein